MDEGKIKLTVIFGEKACDVYDEYGFIAAKKVVDYEEGDIVEKFFNTEGEVEAYKQGLADADGWFASWVLTDKDLEEDRQLRIQEGSAVHWNDPAISDYEDRQAAYDRVFFVESIDWDEETAWIREDGDVFAQTEVYLSELELIKDENQISS